MPLAPPVTIIVREVWSVCMESDVGDVFQHVFRSALRLHLLESGWNKTPAGPAIPWFR